MKVETPDAEIIDLGITETAPTVSIVDYSRRVTDDFGVTTVVKRDWSTRIGVRTRLASSRVDEVQRALAALRATAVTWSGEEGFDFLTAEGFYKDFSIDLQLGDVSFCSLTIEGLPNGDLPAPNVDPAITPPSNFRVLASEAMTDATLASSSVAEDDYPEWASNVLYPLGGLVMKASTHRVYESLSDGNLGNDPADDPSNWLDLRATNRWAMFDQAVGSATSSDDAIVVAITPGAGVTGLAVLDTDAASVRVQAPGYDGTVALDGRTSATFLDLNVAAGATITVTIGATDQAVSVGTLLVGAMEALGVTEASPSIGITDYSRKETDDFGNVVPIERAWAKRLSARTLVATDAVAGLVRRIAALRGTPALWIGDADFDSLTIYGFFKDFSAEVSEQTTTCSLTIEGLSKAAPIADPEEPVGATIFWGGTEPASARIDDLWIKDDGTAWRYLGSGEPEPFVMGGAEILFDGLPMTWADPGGWVLSSLSEAIKLAGGNTYFPPSDTPPTAGKAGDLWFDTAAGVLKRWNGVEWAADGPDKTDQVVATMPQVPAITVNANYLGVVNEGQLPRTIYVARYRGSEDVSSSTHYTLTVPDGVTAAIDDAAGSGGRGTITISALTVAAAVLHVTSERDGVTLEQDIQITRVDGGAPVSDGAGAGDPVTDTTLEGIGGAPTFTRIAGPSKVQVGASGDVELSLQSTYRVTGGDEFALIVGAGKMRMSADGSTGWTDVAGSAASVIGGYRWFNTAVTPEYPRKGYYERAGSMSALATAEDVPEGDYWFDVVARVASGDGTIDSFSGSFTARPL